MYNAGMKDLDKESSKPILSSDLKQILSEHKKWLDSNGKEGAAADLKNRNLKGAVFIGANL